ncbi:MAG: BON domain-containing protein [Acidobacteriia bacterium]|nr:BON domain-containing protein [Terriglobia bacterium]
MKRVSILLFLAAVVLALAVGCSRARSDAQIIGEVVTKINADPKISEKHVSVMSSNGVVTLSGSAVTEEERAQAANDAAQVEGVKTVVNNLLLDAPPSMQASALPPAVDEKVEKPAARTASPSRPGKKPSAYRERRQESASARNAANDMPIISSGPSVNTPMVAMAPMPTSSAPAVPPPPPPPTPVTIESGTVLNIRMIDPVDTGKNHAGDSFRATLDSPITVGDKVVIPEGADVVGRIADLKDAGHFAGQPELALELSSLSVNGRKYTLHTNQYSRQGKSRGASTAKKVGAGAAIGAIIGGIAGGGKGAAIGAATGAGVGGGAQAVTKPEEVRVDSEALLSFRLESPLTLMPVSNLQRPRNNYSGTYNAPPPPDNNDDDIIDYSDNSNSNSNSNRPVLKRRPGTTDQSGNNPPQ